MHGRQSVFLAIQDGMQKPVINAQVPARSSGEHILRLGFVQFGWV